MTDLTKVPLNDDQVAYLTRMGVRLFHDFKARKTYISEGYWHQTHPQVQRALIVMVTGHD